MKQKTIILAAGGTGGHLFPAQALAVELERRGFKTHLLTDERARVFASYFLPDQIHIVLSATITGKNPLKLVRSLWQIFQGMRFSRQVFIKYTPHIVVGFGGYPSLPPLLTAIRMKLPTLIHEQNAVMGRANRLLSRYVRAIAGGFLEQRGKFAAKIVLTGNPLRADMIEAAAQPYQPAVREEDFKLLIFGGSQGASFFAQIMPQVLALMAPQKRARLKIVQQARPAEVEALQQTYRHLNIAAEIAPFFTDMAQKIADAHFIIARSGASTVAEIAAIGRPSLLVPYPGALDHDQAANARFLADNGGAMVIQERDLPQQKLKEVLNELIEAPHSLVQMAAAAKQVGSLHATTNLADLVEKLILS